MAERWARALGDFSLLQCTVYFNTSNAENNWRNTEPD
jgi:hypothetical protein